MTRALELAIAICDGIVDQQLARDRIPAWSWGPALFGFALSELDAYAGGRYQRWLRRYCDHYVAHPPTIDQSDRAAPGLITEAMHRRTGNPAYAELTNRVVDYIRSEPRLVGDAVNHLGPSAIGRCYPRSVWVDSLMMFGVFAARYGRDHAEPDLVEIAARQPGAYAELMQDPGSGLWYHAWWARTGRPYPGRGIHWGRGNGWVIAASPMITDAIGDHRERPRIETILQRTSDALLRVMSADGTWPTLLTEPSYRELSATALIAGGWFHSVRNGSLPERFRAPATRALAAVSDRVRRRRGRWELPEISGPTIPLPLLPRTGYRLVPRGANYGYGVAAYALAAINEELAGG